MMDINKDGTKELTKDNWYYFENVIEINDIEDNETTRNDKEAIDDEKTKQVVNTVVELCDEVTSPVETIEQEATKKTAGNESDNEIESKKKKDEIEKAMYEEFEKVVEQNTTKGRLNEKKQNNKKRDNYGDNENKKEGNEMKKKTSKRIRR